MESQSIRQNFLKYFQKQGHAAVPSSSVIPHDDPSLLFINAGMNQFKDVFLGKSRRDYTRAATSQKCVRVGGKHNDLDNVGHTRRHLTFFEMLGNFSFGDYFKKEAIAFAWEVSTQVFGFDPDYIWPTVFREDDEAFELWTAYVPAEKITRFDEKDNFWAMGETGPCGPCSELLYDRGPRYGKASCPKEDVDGERFLEFWNLVFMQFNRGADGSMTPLPKPSIDTGSGLERVVSLKMDVDNVFETDILRHLIAGVERVSGLSYDPKNSETAPAFRVIADHLRCLSFAIADGAQPSNVDRGYVLRKVLRRAVRYGRTLGLKDPFLAKLLPDLVATMGQDYPELEPATGRIAEILSIEEEAFMRTLRRGGNLLNQVIENSQRHRGVINGDDAFKLKDTYGLPLEEILLLAKDQHLSVDLERFEFLEKEARDRSKKAHQATRQEVDEGSFANMAHAHGASTFLGYESLESDAKVVAMLQEGENISDLAEGQEGMVLLDKTPFYAEKGGQVGDRGWLEGKEGQLFEVMDSQEPYKGLIAHHGIVKKGAFKVGQKVHARVEGERRQKIANNHTATHLLHWALQQVLGSHVRQAGSVVDDERLRFDFSHHKALTPEETRQIEDLVNHKIRDNDPVVWYETAYTEVQKNPEIKQFFGDKYDSQVRVVDLPFSKELCGGTHTSRVGNIGYFRIAKEGSIAAGVRRIEAVTGHAAEQLARGPEATMELLADKLKAPASKLEERVEQLLEEQKRLERQLKDIRKEQVGSLVQELSTQVEQVHDIPLLAVQLPLGGEELKEVADRLMEKLPSLALVLAAAEGQKCTLLVRVSNDLVAKGVKANEIVREIAPLLKGGGGGKPQAAQAGGTQPDKIPDALARTKELLSVKC